jgi:hypothetical protein
MVFASGLVQFFSPDLLTPNNHIPALIATEKTPESYFGACHYRKHGPATCGADRTGQQSYSYLRLVTPAFDRFCKDR